MQLPHVIIANVSHRVSSAEGPPVAEKPWRYTGHTYTHRYSNIEYSSRQHASMCACVSLREWHQVFVRAYPRPPKEYKKVSCIKDAEMLVFMYVGVKGMCAWV